MKYEKEYGVIVVGAGHAGLEAALASARLGVDTLLLTLNLDTIGKMSCNPAIGGPGKSQLVREIDALGGEMSRATDATFLQMKMLNLSKGPAVHSLRAQSDRAEYVTYMKRVCENTPGLDIKQAEASELIMENGIFRGVKTRLGFDYYAQAIVIATGTFLQGKIFIGMESLPAGRLGDAPAELLTKSLNEHGIRTGRLKTGTTPRIDRRTVDFTKLQEEPGMPELEFFSFDTLSSDRPQRSCYLTKTNLESHKIIMENLDRSPLYQGIINASGPRYCPSIEDKVVRFPDKTSHHLFIEPEGNATNELYVQGFSTSLPYDVQLKVLRTMPGLEKVEVMRPGYAIAYDFIYPEQLDRTLRLKDLVGVYAAGQLNGTSGYEEAAAQGLVAGINAALFVKKEPEFVLLREESYIGTLVDDLITKEIREPYRMMTSRSEYRMYLRQDNADDRLLEKGYKLGLNSASRFETFCISRDKLIRERKNLRAFRSNGTTAYDLLKKNEINYSSLYALGYVGEELSATEKAKLEIEIHYEGYLADVAIQIERARKAEKRQIPTTLNYQDLKGLKVEARDKLQKVRPATLGQASRIAGVSPSDISVLLVYMEKFARNV